MAKILYGTSWIAEDEPCLILYEQNLMSPGMGWRRFQIIHVVRGDELAECRIDMGPAKEIKADQFQVLGGFRRPDGRLDIVHTVGELRDIADHLREYQPFDKRELARYEQIRSG